MSCVIRDFTIGERGNSLAVYRLAGLWHSQEFSALLRSVNECFRLMYFYTV